MFSARSEFAGRESLGVAVSECLSTFFAVDRKSRSAPVETSARRSGADKGDRRMARRTRPRRRRVGHPEASSASSASRARGEDASRAGTTASASRSGDTGVRTVETGPLGFVNLGGRVLLLELGIELLRPGALLAGDDHQPAAGGGARGAGGRERGGDADGGERGERHRVSQRGARGRVRAKATPWPRGASSHPLSLFRQTPRSALPRPLPRPVRAPAVHCDVSLLSEGGGVARALGLDDGRRPGPERRTRLGRERRDGGTRESASRPDARNDWRRHRRAFQPPGAEPRRTGRPQCVIRADA